MAKIRPSRDWSPIGDARMSDVVRYGILIGFAWMLWLAFQPRVAFLIRIAGGEGRLERGTSQASLLAEVNEVCRREGIESGTVRGLERSGQVSLAFSKDVPPPARQQLRNWWVSAHPVPAAKSCRRC